MRRLAVVVAAVAVAAAAALLFDGALATMVKRTFAAECPRTAPAPTCLATLPATVEHTWDDYGDGEPYERLVALDVPDNGRIDAWLSFPDADRLNIDFDTDVDEVTVTLFDGAVVALTAPNGETAPARHAVRPSLAALELAGWLLLIAALLAALRIQWLRRAAAASAAGAVTAVVTTLITDAFVTAAWAVPIMVAACLTAAAAVVLIGKREHTTTAIRWHS